MQIMFAAPFIVGAGIVFTVLSLIPRARRQAIPIPTGIIGAGPASLLGFIVGALLIHFAVHDWPNRTGLVVYLGGAAFAGLAGGIGCWFLARLIAWFLPAPLLRLAVFVAGWCSYFVVITGALFFVRLSIEGHSNSGWPVVVLTLSLELLLSFVGAWLIARKSEEFRPNRFRLPRGAPFHDRGEEPERVSGTGRSSDEQGLKPNLL
jgi:hypothetical protein